MELIAFVVMVIIGFAVMLATVVVALVIAAQSGSGPFAAASRPAIPMRQPPKLPLVGYRLRNSILTKPELAFYNAISFATSNCNIRLSVKPRIEDVILVANDGRSFGERQSNRGKIKSRHFDFVLCTADWRPLAAIEVDDSSHQAKARRKVDQFKNDLCQSVGLPMLRFRAYPTASQTEIRRKLSGVLRFANPMHTTAAASPPGAASAGRR